MKRERQIRIDLLVLLVSALITVCCIGRGCVVWVEGLAAQRLQVIEQEATK